MRGSDVKTEGPRTGCPGPRAADGGASPTRPPPSPPRADRTPRKRALLLGSGLLLAGHGALRPLPSPSIGLRALPPHREPAPMPQPAIAPDVGEALDVRGHLTPQIALDPQPLDDFAQLLFVLRREILDPHVGVDPGLGEDALRGRQTDPEDVRETDLDALVARQIDAGDASHLSLNLLVLGVDAADHANASFAADVLARIADALDGGSNFHNRVFSGGRGAAERSIRPLSLRRGDTGRRPDARRRRARAASGSWDPGR